MVYSINEQTDVLNGDMSLKNFLNLNITDYYYYTINDTWTLPNELYGKSSMSSSVHRDKLPHPLRRSKKYIYTLISFKLYEFSIIHQWAKHTIFNTRLDHSKYKYWKYFQAWSITQVLLILCWLHLQSLWTCRWPSTR